MSPRIVLYSADICPYAHRARIALKAAKVDFEIVEIDLMNKPEWYAPNVNPASKVPAIWYDAPKDADVTKPPPGTFVLPESGLIVDFVTSLYPQIAPSDPLEKARAAYVNAQFEALVSPKMYALASSDGDKNGTAYKEFLEGVKKFLQYLPDSYVDDKEFNNADILIAPFIARTWVSFKNNASLWPDAQAAKDLVATLETPEYAKFAKYHEKLSNWSAVSETWDIEDTIKKSKIRYQKIRDEKK